MVTSILHFNASEISREHLEIVARALFVEVVEDSAVLRNACFEQAFQLCQKGKWSLIDPIARDLSCLVDELGRTLLIKAVIQQKSAIVRGLTERAVGISTTDPLGKTILHYLVTGSAGISSTSYALQITEKLKTQYSEESLAPLNQELQQLSYRYQTGQSLLQDIIRGRVPPEQGIDMLQSIINQYRGIFGCFHPGILSYMCILEKLQQSLGKPEAEATREKYKRLFFTLFGFVPIPLEEFSEPELLKKAQKGIDVEVDRFLESCRTRFMVNPDQIGKIVNLLVDLSNTYYRLDRYERAISIANSILFIPEEVQKFQPELFADINRQMGQLHIHVKKYERAEDFFSKAIDLCNQSLKTDHPLRFQCYSDRAQVYLFLGQFNRAEKDCREALAFANVTTTPHHPYFLCEVFSRLASILYQKMEYEEAREYSQKALDLSITSKALDDPLARGLYTAALGNLGKSLLELGDYDKAIAYIQKVVDLCETGGKKNNDLVTALLDLGNAYSKKGDLDSALETYQRAHETCGDSHQSQAISAAALGRFYLKNGDFEQAAHYSQEAAEVFASLQGSLTHDDSQITIFERQVEAYREWEHALLNAGKWQEALVVSDKRRARALTNNLSQRICPEKPVFSDLTLDEMFHVAEQCK